MFTLLISFIADLNCCQEKPYVIAVNVKSFGIIPTAEEFCRAKAGEIGATMMDDLVRRYIPVVAGAVKAEMSKTFRPDTLPTAS